MEDQPIYVTPDTALSVLDLFSTSREGIVLFASKVINAVEAGEINPLKVQIYCKTLEEISDKIKGAIKAHAKTEAAKYGDKPFMFAGAELHLTSVHTSYDFSMCGDHAWDMFSHGENSNAEGRKERETFLKALKEPMEVLDSVTGEVIILCPPVKKSTEGIKVSIK